MCGRVAQTLQSTISAWNMLNTIDDVAEDAPEGTSSDHADLKVNEDKCNAKITSASSSVGVGGSVSVKLPLSSSSSSSVSQSPSLRTAQSDNYNLGPGMSSVIFHKQPKSTTDDDVDDASTRACTGITQKEKNSRSSSSSSPSICSTTNKVWGICPKSGTKNHPLPPGPGKHFSNLMFNARSETLYEKRTFRNLALTGNVSNANDAMYYMLG